jgi:2-oxoisovalerate dehydrogenase E1 component alpha subunit
MIAVTRQAVERARRGEGPTLIEALTYRVQGHSTSDDPRAYRPDEEVEPWRKRDPIARLRACLNHKGLWDDARDQALRQEVEEQVRSAAAEAEKLGLPQLSTITEDVFATRPWHLEEQQAEIDAMGYVKGH